MRSRVAQSVSPSLAIPAGTASLPGFIEAPTGVANLSRERAITRRLVLSGPAGFFAA
jgi:hypothetical protein